MLQVNEQIPTDIALLDQSGQSHTLEDYLGKYLVIYFYPKDSTPGCTAEACSLRDYNSKIEKLGAKIIGVSRDSVSSHKKFADNEKLNFTLLSDPDSELQQAFGTWVEKKMFGKSYMGTSRSTFIVDPQGKVLRVWEKVKPENHGEEVFNELKNILK